MGVSVSNREEIADERKTLVVKPLSMSLCFVRHMQVTLIIDSGKILFQSIVRGEFTLLSMLCDFVTELHS